MARPTASVRGRPRAFNDDDLIRAALELGPDRLSLGDVAAALGVPRSTVYNRVANPEDLGALVLSSRLESVLDTGWSAPAQGDWRDCLRSWVLHLRAAMLAGGPWIRYFQAERHLDARALMHAEIVLERLVAEGFSVAQAGRAIGLVVSLYRDSAVVRASRVIAGLDANDPANEQAQFDYNLDRALDGIACTLRRARRRPSIPPKSGGGSSIPPGPQPVVDATG